MSTTTTDRRRPSTRLLVLAGVVVVLVGVLGALGVATVAWGDQLRDEGRLLPGTTIASVAVGGSTTEEAVEAVRDHLDARLDREIDLTDGTSTWTTSARDLGGVADVEAAVAAARSHTEQAGFGELARVRWTNGSADFSTDVGIDVPDEGIEDFVATVAGDIDRDPVDATASWGDGHVVVSEAITGRTLERDAAAQTVRELLDGDGDTAELTVATIDPQVSTGLVQQVADAVDEAAVTATGHAVTVSLDGETRTVTPAELGAETDVQRVLADALATATRSGTVAVDPVGIELDDEALTGVVDDLAEGKEVAGRDAEITYADGALRVVAERTGVSVNRSEARERLRAALAGDGEAVELEFVTTAPSVTADSFGTVLLLDQSARKLHLYNGADRQRTWTVAVGTNNSPTPTGTYVVGAKRFEPTWVNPAPDRWGADMPERIGPGPSNPLGLRALNWNTRSGRDTLIRFHGTPNESSIGSASSNGCVRMYNSDVIDLYDLVPSGTTIVSVA
ncbi:L,D-transpeptidase family protein [Egicoccus halophilus]|uniref:L,D-TPase catalytic domain-containing protein n=1 Tax=Egicoccus halophilus TaxID=1670830 RepID=A0A8J3EWT2_9ACTN|nr:peptidoglycan binding domain-containing protein [Egicoccus halophilus]GGI04363.1 hypothetical protein GCM10011354_08720 [Egicoccus halophilus]